VRKLAARSQQTIRSRRHEPADPAPVIKVKLGICLPAAGAGGSLLPGIMRSQDAAEGLRSFIERREARFTGH